MAGLVIFPILAMCRLKLPFTKNRGAFTVEIQNQLAIFGTSEASPKPASTHLRVLKGAVLRYTLVIMARSRRANIMYLPGKALSIKGKRSSRAEGIGMAV
jgi:hypothetical protein